MKLLRVAMMALAVSTFSSAWNCSPKCPDYEECLEEERKRGNGRLLNVEQTSVAKQSNTTTNLRTRRRHLGQTRFLLKMYHEESTQYCWQSEWKDRGWCIECEECKDCFSASCDEGDRLWIKYCNDNKDEQYLVYEPVSGSGGGRIKPYTAQNLCLERNGDSKYVALQRCEDGNTAQILVGFDMHNGPFELYPYGNDPDSTDAPLCLSQSHHPKKREIIKAFACEDSRDDKTSFWIVHEAVVEGNPLGMVTPEPTAAPTPDGSDPPLVVLENGGCSPSSPCGHCYGDCDTDFDCIDDLECYHRARYEAVPSCSGGKDMFNR